MAGRSLRPQLNTIRTWVREGRTDAWIAHQLEVPATELREFKRQHGLEPGEEGEVASFEELDLRDEIEAEIEAAQEAEEEEDEEEDSEDEEPEEGEGDEDDGEREPARSERSGQRSRRPRERSAGAGRERAPRASRERKDEDDEDGERKPRRRRGGRGRGRKAKSYEASFDHGEKDGYGLWLDPAVSEDPVYTESWAGHRPVQVTIEADRIVIERSGGEAKPQRPRSGDGRPQRPRSPRPRST